MNIVAWIPKSTIPKDELHTYDEVAARTRTVLSPASDPAHLVSPPSHSLSLITEAISAPLDDVRTFTLSPELTLSGNGEEACLTKLGVELNFEGAKLPDLWFDEDQGKLMDVQQVEGLLRAWCKVVGKDIRVNASPDASGSAARVYHLVDAPADPSSSSSGSTQPNQSGSRRQWPDNIPAVPQDSTIYKLGSVGFGLVTGIVGQPIANKIEDAGWNMLERFSRVTNYARNTTVQVLEHPLARPILPLIPPNIRSYFLSSAEAEALLEEYDSFGQYLARYAGELGERWRPTHPSEAGKLVMDKSGDFENLAIGHTHHRTGRPLSAEQWVSFYDASGRLTVSREYVRAYVFASGVENDIRVDVWKYLLNVYPWDSSESERAKLLDARRAEYESMKQHWKNILSEAAEIEDSPKPSGQEGTSSRAGDEREDGDVVSKLKERKYRVEKDVVRTDRTVPFFAGTETDTVNPPPPTDSEAEGAAQLAALSSNLEMLKNVLITYTMYNFDLGYVQGMNDLLAPILAVMRDESEAFWCFVEFMNTMQTNFYRDQSGMRNQLRRLELLIKFVDPFLYEHLERTDSINLFICFRWLLVLFKREFEFEDASRLWEVLWACPLTKHFHLFVALAILNRERRKLCNECGAFDEMLKYVNDLSTHIPLEATLQRAEVLFYVFRARLITAAKEQLGVDVNSDASADLPGGANPAPSAQFLDVRTGRKDGVAEAVERNRSRSRTPEPVKRVEVTKEELWELVGLLEKA
ncbi:GTPase activating protein [Borealophlyctis nickersoniae]|nr:GTPase activating protein [Borealophlyctis nickersoniae]